jgi:amidase
MDDFVGLDATAQAALVRRGKVSPLELVDAAIARIEAVNGTLNAVVTPTFELAREMAARATTEGLFAGVPFLLKDFGTEWAGVRFTEGSRFAGEYVSPFDQELAIRYRRAGLVLCGKTNTAEFGLQSTTEPSRFGPTLNPWSLTHSPGGSSGGSAAAVAAGMVPMAHGNDGGGSIRQPAAWCGLFGLKPTRGRVPLGPRYGDVLAGLVAEHVLTRTVRDSAAALDATSGPEPGDPFVLPAPARKYADDAEHDPPSLRIAVTEKSFNGVDVDAACVATMHEAATLCAALGHHVVEAAPDIDVATFDQHFLGLWAAFADWVRIDWEERTGRTVEIDDFDDASWVMAERGRSQRAGQHLKNVQEIQRTARIVGRFFADVDVLLTPIAAVPSLPVGSFHGRGSLTAARNCLAFTMLANATGQPAMSVPMSPSANGLPRGAHFIGRFADETTLIRLAGQLERAKPWHHHHPPTSAFAARPRPTRAPPNNALGSAISA